MDSTQLLEEKETTLSKFHKRNKILILILFSLIISLALITGALILHLLHTVPSSESDNVNPAVQAFCSVTEDISSCIISLNPIIGRKSNTYPDQIFNLYLKTSVEQLEIVTMLLSRDNNTLRNCSSSLQDALGQLKRASTSVRATPDLDFQSTELRSEILNGIIAAEHDLTSFLDELTNLEKSTAVNEAKANVYGVKIYVESCADYLMRLDEVDSRFREVVAANMNSWWAMENMLGICLFGSPYLLLLLMFCSLYRIRRR